MNEKGRSGGGMNEGPRRRRRDRVEAGRGQAEPGSDGGTRGALLDAGRRVFAEHGFAGASIRAITTEAGANLGAITYHFGSKQAFYDAVVDRTVKGLADAVLAAADEPGTGMARAEAVVRAHFTYLARYPEIPRLLLQGVVASGMPPRAALRHLRRVLEAITALVRAGQEDGSIRTGDPVLLGLGLLSPSMQLAVMREPLRAMADVDLGKRAVQDRVTEHVIRFACAALAPSHGGSAR